MSFLLWYVIYASTSCIDIIELPIFEKPNYFNAIIFLSNLLELGHFFVVRRQPNNNK